MRRKTLFLAALLLAMAVTGCRKKETIDLSSCRDGKPVREGTFQGTHPAGYGAYRVFLRNRT